MQHGTARLFLATHSGKQHAKTRQAFRLARSHDFAIFEETHSNIGKSLAARIPSDLQAFWSHGSNYQAGVSISIKRDFLKILNPVPDADWVGMGTRMSFN